MAADWRTENCGEFIGAMRDILGDGNQKSLFEGQEAANLESLRRMTAAFPLQKLMLDEVIQSVADGQIGPDALQEGIANACLERALRGVRQVEEHYRVEKKSLVAHMRKRMEAGIEACQIDNFVSECLGSMHNENRCALQKQQDIDDGVSLP